MMYEDYQQLQQHRQNDEFYRENVVPIKLNESWAGRRLIEALSHLPPQSLSSSLDVSWYWIVGFIPPRSNEKIYILTFLYTEKNETIIIWI